MTGADLVQHLEAVRQTARGQYIARCPAHEDRRPSLSVRELDDGRVLLHCFAGCPVDEVVAAVGLELRDLFPPGEHRPAPRHRRWNYRALLRELRHEAWIVALAAGDLHRGRRLSDEDLARLGEAVVQIERVVRVTDDG